MTTDFIRNTGIRSPTNRNYHAFLCYDLFLIIPLLLLMLFGLYVLYSASGQDMELVLKQIIRFGLGFFIIIIVVQCPQSLWIQLAPFLYCVGVGLLVAVFFIGTDAKGAQRWIVIPGLARLQPSEVMKLAIPLLLASMYAKKSLPPTKFLFFIGSILILIPTLLIAKQPDLGTSILIAYSGFTTLLLAGLPWLMLGALAILSIPTMLMIWHYFMHEYQKTRVLTLLDPSSDPLGAGWNIIQSKAAIGSGGLNGKGWLEGTQSQLNFLPESSTDFIIAVIAEELGFKGVIILFTLYMVICLRGILISWYAQDTFGRLLAGTLTFTFFIYIVVNVGMVSGLLPVVGVPLPLVSYGGSSVVSLMTGFGLILAVHAQHYR